MSINHSGKNLAGAVFQGQALVGAKFRKAMLRGADFSGCDLRSADFRGADLREAKFGKAVMDRSRWAGAMVAMVALLVSAALSCLVSVFVGGLGALAFESSRDLGERALYGAVAVSATD